MHDLRRDTNECTSSVLVRSSREAILDFEFRRFSDRVDDELSLESSDLVVERTRLERGDDSLSCDAQQSETSFAESVNDRRVRETHLRPLYRS